MAAVLSPWGVIADEPIFKNGGFELPSISGRQTITPTDWTSRPNGGFLLSGGPVGGYPAPQEGFQYSSIGGGFLSQAFAITFDTAGGHFLKWYDNAFLDTNDCSRISRYLVTIMRGPETVIGRIYDAAHGKDWQKRD